MKFYIVGMQNAGEPMHFFGMNMITEHEQISAYNYDNEPEVKPFYNWEVGLDRLLERNGPAFFDGCEIHSHGVPGYIAIHPGVTSKNVALFGSKVAPLVRIGGLMEVMCCSVASCDWGAVLAALEAKGGSADDVAAIAALDASLDASLGGSDGLGPRMTRERKVFDEKLHAELARRGTTWAASTKDEFNAANRHVGLNWGDPNVRAYRSMPDLSARDIPWFPAFEALFRHEQFLKNATGAADGPILCRRLAQASGCTVRAASARQVNEGAVGPYQEGFGNWEGFVFDFTARGLSAVYWNKMRQDSYTPRWQPASLVQIA
jgi:hypothetical protein